MAAREKSALSEMRSLVRHFFAQPPRETNCSNCCGFGVPLEKVEFKDSGITVVGISPDPVAAIKDFATKHNVTVCGLRLLTRVPSCPDNN